MHSEMVCSTVLHYGYGFDIGSVYVNMVHQICQSAKPRDFPVFVPSGYALMQLRL